MKTISHILVVSFVNLCIVGQLNASPLNNIQIDINELEINEFLELVELIEKPEQANKAIESFAKTNLKFLSIAELKYIIDKLKKLPQDSTDVMTYKKTKYRVVEAYYNFHVSNLNYEQMQGLIALVDYPHEKNRLIYQFVHLNLDEMSWSDAKTFIEQLEFVEDVNHSYKLNSTKTSIHGLLFEKYLDTDDMETMIQIAQAFSNRLGANRWLEAYYFHHKENFNNDDVKALLLGLRQTNQFKDNKYSAQKVRERIIHDWAKTKK